MTTPGAVVCPRCTSVRPRGEFPLRFHADFRHLAGVKRNCTDCLVAAGHDRSQTAQGKVAAAIRAQVQHRAATGPRHEQDPAVAAAAADAARSLRELLAASGGHTAAVGALRDIMRSSRRVTELLRDACEWHAYEERGAAARRAYSAGTTEAA